MNVGLSLLKQFVIREGPYFELRFEAFNSVESSELGTSSESDALPVVWNDHEYGELDAGTSGGA
jgi:hypothetical protein